MGHRLRKKRYFTNNLCDYSGDISAEEIHSKYEKDILQEIENVVGLISNNIKAAPPQESGGLYVGLSGIAFALFRVSQSEHLPPGIKEFCLSLVDTYLASSLEYCARKSEDRHCIGASFLCGHLGVYAFAAVYFARTGNAEKSKQYLDKFISLHKMCAPVNFIDCGGDELLVGRAGYLCAVLYLQQELGDTVVPGAVIQTIVNSIIKSGREGSARMKSPSPLMYSYYGTLYLGAAHGLSSILQMLLSFYNYLDSEARKDVTAACYCLLTCETGNNNYPAALDESKDDLWHWCHGSPGIIYFLIKAQQVLQDNDFGKAAVRAAGEPLWRLGLLQKGPGICHGIAGSGYAFLALYRATGELKPLYRAHQFAQFMFTEEFRSQARVPDCPFSLFEGWAGTLCFLVDLLNPQSSSFPFFNVFK